MDNKRRLGFAEDQTDKEFYGPFYKRFLSESKHEIIHYVFEDIKIIEPKLADARHIYKCFAEDNGLTEDDLKTDKRAEVIHQMDQVILLFGKPNDETIIRFMFKGDEFAGHARYIDLSKEKDDPKKISTSIVGTQIDSGKYDKEHTLLATKWYIRPKFRHTLCAVCFIDGVTNLLSPGYPVLTNEKHMSSLLKIYRTGKGSLKRALRSDLESKRYQAARIIQKRLLRNKKNGI